MWDCIILGEAGNVGVGRAMAEEKTYDAQVAL
jgi:hypothetical protein